MGAASDPDDMRSAGQQRLAVVAAAAAVAILSLLPASPVSAAEPPEHELTIFWGNGCPHCEAEWQFLFELSDEFPDLVINSYEVWGSEANRALMEQALAEHGESVTGVPVTIVGGQVFHGYNDAIGRSIRSVVASLFTETPLPSATSGDVIDLPLIGPVDVGSSSLVVSTVAIAVVDGINPCSLWAMSVLMALVLRTGSRRRVLAIGGTFLIITTALYGLYIAGLYGALSYLAGAAWVRWAMAAVALVLGLINLKDFYWFKRGPSLSISDKAKPGLYRRMRAVATEDQPLGSALMATGALAVGVSLLETPCTAGYPVLWTNLLADQAVPIAGASALFGLYMLVFLIDELVVFGAAVVAMRVTKIEERGGRVLKLIGGMVMVVLAVTLIVAPSAMESVGGALAVFAIAAALVLIALLVERVRRKPSDRTGATSTVDRRPPVHH